MFFLHNSILRKLLLFLTLGWGVATFSAVNFSSLHLIILLLLVAIPGIIFIITESSPLYLLILLSFTTSYASYVFLFRYNLPVWLVMIAILIIFGFLFFYIEQKIGILGNRRLIYLVLFSLIQLEVFLVLSYFLIDPVSLSLVIASMSYLFLGFCYSILAKHEDKSFLTYLFISILTILVVFLFAQWGGLV